MRLLCVVALCFLTGALLMAQGRPTPDGSIQARNKSVAMRVFDEIFNRGKFQVADEIYAPDFQNHGLHQSVDLKTDQEAVHAEKKAFPDLRMSVQEMVAEGDKVAVLWTFQGTHTGSGYEGLPPTGTRVEIRGVTIWRIVDGRIVEERSSFSETGAYIRMFAHLKWWLVFVGLLVLTMVIAIERLVWMMGKKMFAIGGSTKLAKLPVRYANPPTGLGEGSLLLWLLIVGVNPQRWNKLSRFAPLIILNRRSP